MVRIVANDPGENIITKLDILHWEKQVYILKFGTGKQNWKEKIKINKKNFFCRFGFLRA